MLKILGFYRRRSDITQQAFFDHWEKVHGPLITGNVDMMKHIVRYVQHRLAPMPDSERSAFDFEGFSEVWVRDLNALKTLTDLPWIREVLIPDEERFIDMSAKRISLLDDQVIQIGGTS